MSTDPTPTSRAAEVMLRHSYLLSHTTGGICECGFVPTVDPKSLATQQDYHRVHLAQALADAGLLREQEPEQGGLTEADNRAIQGFVYDYAQPSRRADMAFALADFLAARGGTAAAGDEGLRRGVQKMLLDWPHDDTCPAFTRSGACECWHSELSALLDATPAPTEDRFYLGQGIDQRRCAACAAAPTLPCAEHRGHQPCTGASDCSARLHEHGCYADHDGTAYTDPDEHDAPTEDPAPVEALCRDWERLAAKHGPRATLLIAGAATDLRAALAATTPEATGRDGEPA